MNCRILFLGLVLILILGLLGCAAAEAITDDIYVGNIYPGANNVSSVGGNGSAFKAGWFNSIYVSGKTIYEDGVAVNLSGNGTQLPNQAGQSGKYLSTNGTSTNWTNVSASVAWGGITGTLSDQADLLTALDTKGTSNVTLPITTGNVTGLDAALAGKEPTIANGLVSQFWSGIKTWITLSNSHSHTADNITGGTNNQTIISSSGKGLWATIQQTWVANLVSDLAGKATNTFAGIVAALGYTPADNVTTMAHINNTSNPHSVTKAQIGLAAVDNTADVTKSVAYAVTSGTATSSNSTSGNAATANTSIKLTTPRTINGTNFDGTANIDAVPTWRVGQTTRNISLASGTQNIAHGLARTPKYVHIRAQMIFSATVSMEVNGYYDTTSQSGMYIGYTEGSSVGIIDNIFQSTAAALGLNNVTTVNPFTGATKASGIVTVDGTNIIITWTKTGLPTGIANLAWEAQ